MVGKDNILEAGESFWVELEYKKEANKMTIIIVQVAELNLIVAE